MEKLNIYNFKSFSTSLTVPGLFFSVARAIKSELQELFRAIILLIKEAFMVLTVSNINIHA